MSKVWVIIQGNLACNLLWNNNKKKIYISCSCLPQIGSQTNNPSPQRSIESMNESWIAHFVSLHSVEKCLCWLPANVFCCPSRWTAVSIIWCLHQFHNQFHNCLLWCRGVLIPPSSHKWQPLYYLPRGEQAFCKSAVRPPHKWLNCTEFYTLSVWELHLTLVYVGLPSPTEKHLSLSFFGEKRTSIQAISIRSESRKHPTELLEGCLSLDRYSLSPNVAVSIQSSKCWNNWVWWAETSSDCCLEQCLRLSTKETQCQVHPELGSFLASQIQKQFFSARVKMDYSVLTFHLKGMKNGVKF